MAEKTQNIESAWFTDIVNQGRIQDFKLGVAHLKKMRRAEGGANILGIFRVKNHDFTPKIIFFPILGGARPLDPPLSISIYESSYMFSSIGIAIMNDSSYRQNMVGWLVYGA